jgi:hypothetical protein
MVVLIFLLLLAAVAGVLGTVLKAFAFVAVTVVLAAILLAVIAWYGVKYKLGKIERGLGQGRTDVQIGRPRREQERLPGRRDDRY